MSRDGWLPPGVTDADIDRAAQDYDPPCEFDEEGICMICGRGPADDDCDLIAQRSTGGSMSYVTKARKLWPKAIWIIGNGPYASVSHCNPAETVMLFQTQHEAEIAKAAIDDTACGGSCSKQHEIVDLETGRLIANADWQRRRRRV